jgi:cell division septation protein DedD
MADKNLHDIKIDDLDSPKKTPLKNILTLLALLFIILAISVVITKLIINTDDEGKEVDTNANPTELVADSSSITDKDNEGEKNSTGSSIATTASVATALAVPTVSNILERNLTSVTKVPLRTHTPKERTVVKNKEPKKIHVSSKTPKKSTSTHKKEYIDKVVAKKAAKKYTSVKKHTPVKKKTTTASYLGGHQKAVTNSYYIKVGTYRDTSTIVNKVKKNKFNYSLVKLKDDKTLTQVYVGPFYSENQAEKVMPKVQKNVLPGAYITKVK